MQVDSELSFILKFILELLQTFCLHRFLVFGRRDALQIQRSDDRTAMSISLEGFFLVLKTLTVLLDQKNRLAVRMVGQFFFFQLLACKRDGGGKTSKLVVVPIWCS